MLNRLSLVLMTLAVAWGCESDFVCVQEVAPAIVVEVRNSETLEFEAQGATGIARSSTVVDTLVPHTSQGATLIRLSTVRAGAGTYAVTVEKAGFDRWEVRGVRVSDGRCGLETVDLVAELEPIG